MKRAIQYAGLFGCGAFTLLTYTILLNSQQMDRMIWVSLPGALLAGFCGYHIGNTLDNPRRRRRKRKIVHLPEVSADSSMNEMPSNQEDTLKSDLPSTTGDTPLDKTKAFASKVES